MDHVKTVKSIQGKTPITKMLVLHRYAQKLKFYCPMGHVNNVTFFSEHKITVENVVLMFVQNYKRLKLMEHVNHAHCTQEQMQIKDYHANPKSAIHVSC